MQESSGFYWFILLTAHVSFWVCGPHDEKAATMKRVWAVAGNQSETFHPTLKVRESSSSCQINMKGKDKSDSYGLTFLYVLLLFKESSLFQQVSRDLFWGCQKELPKEKWRLVWVFLTFHVLEASDEQSNSCPVPVESGNPASDVLKEWMLKNTDIQVPTSQSKSCLRFLFLWQLSDDLEVHGGLSSFLHLLKVFWDEERTNLWV